jgi:hypothetical protein
MDSRFGVGRTVLCLGMHWNVFEILSSVGFDFGFGRIFVDGLSWKAWAIRHWLFIFS